MLGVFAAEHPGEWSKEPEWDDGDDEHAEAAGLESCSLHLDFPKHRFSDTGCIARAGCCRLGCAALFGASDEPKLCESTTLLMALSLSSSAMQAGFGHL